MTTNLLKYLREIFFKEIKLHKKQIQKTNCIQKSLKIKKIKFKRSRKGPAKKVYKCQTWNNSIHVWGLLILVYVTCTMHIKKILISLNLNFNFIFALYDIVLFAFNPFRREIVHQYKFFSCRTLNQTLKNNNKLECDALPHPTHTVTKKTNGKESEIKCLCRHCHLCVHS